MPFFYFYLSCYFRQWPSFFSLTLETPSYKKMMTLKEYTWLSLAWLRYVLIRTNSKRDNILLSWSCVNQGLLFWKCILVFVSSGFHLQYDQTQKPQTWNITARCNSWEWMSLAWHIIFRANKIMTGWYSSAYYSPVVSFPVFTTNELPHSVTL